MEHHKVGEDCIPPLTEAEISEWLWRLAPTDTERAAKIRDLLHNADEDQMSHVDREICRRSLSKLETKASLRRIK